MPRAPKKITDINSLIASVTSIVEATSPTPAETPEEVAHRLQIEKENNQARIKKEQDEAAHQRELQKSADAHARALALENLRHTQRLRWFGAIGAVVVLLLYFALMSLIENEKTRETISSFLLAVITGVLGYLSGKASSDPPEPKPNDTP